MPEQTSLDGLTMGVASTASGGVIAEGTVLRFSQAGDVFWAEYDGGEIVKGFLTGRWCDGVPRFRYAQVGADDSIDGGESFCEVERTSDGRVRLVEHFTWASREGSGVNVFEELKTQ